MFVDLRMVFQQFSLNFKMLTINAPTSMHVYVINIGKIKNNYYSKNCCAKFCLTSLILQYSFYNK